MRRLVTDTLMIAERNLDPPAARARTADRRSRSSRSCSCCCSATCSAARSARPGYSYVDFLIPGIIVQNIAFGGFVTALGLNEDVHKGLIDRFRSLPMARAAVLAGRTLADVVTNTLSIDDPARHRRDHRLLASTRASAT